MNVASIISGSTFGLSNAIGFLVIFVGIALVVGGVALIVSGARLKRDALARRIDLVRSGQIGKALILSQVERATDADLVRIEPQGLPARQQREVVRRLARLKVPAQFGSAVFLGLRLLAAAGFGVLGAIIVAWMPVIGGSRVLPYAIAAGLCIIGFFVPSMVLRVLVKRRAKAVAEGLPDALELLVVCVEAGLALEDSIDRIIGELDRSQPALADELALTSADLKILPSRDQALANLADRVDIPSVRSVVATLSQTMRYGTPLAQAMRTVAAEMRSESLIDLEERANRLPAIMTVPMMLFIMPAIFLVVGGPAALKLLDILAH